MARQEIILGPPPAGLGGDPPRTASLKINAMTQELYDKHAALGTASGMNAQTGSKAGSQQLLRSDLNGVGFFRDLRNTVFVTGLPSDLFGAGMTVGFASAGALGITEVGAGEYGVLTVNMQYADVSGAGGCQQKFEVGAYTFRRIPISATAWGEWMTVGQRSVGLVGAGSYSSIIEKGENGNGEWTKFADGTLIMRIAPKDTAVIPANSFINTQVTSPQALITNNGIQTLSATCTPYLSNDHFGVISTSTGGGSLFNAVIRNGASAAQQFKLNITVIGKWKF